jgi:hypothetical protein
MFSVIVKSLTLRVFASKSAVRMFTKRVYLVEQRFKILSIEQIWIPQLAAIDVRGVRAKSSLLTALSQLAQPLAAFHILQYP